MLFLECFSGMVKHREKPATAAVHTWSALYHLQTESSITWHVTPSYVYAVPLACTQHAGLAAHMQLIVQCMHCQLSASRLNQTQCSCSGWYLPS